MSYPAKTLFLFGLYLLVLGALLVAAPNPLLVLFRFRATSEVWIRVVGMLLLFLGAYDVLAARTELRRFLAWSVPLRLSVAVFFGAFVAAGLVSPMLLLFAAIDVAAAAWTWSALGGKRAAPGEGQQGLIDPGDIPRVLSILRLASAVLFPAGILPLAVGRRQSVDLVKDAVREEQVIGVVTQRRTEEEDPGATGLYTVAPDPTP
jgi:hypothetical protein